MNKFIGILSIILGLVFLIILAIPVFFMVIGSWTADRGPGNFLDWLTLFFLNRIFLGAFYLSFCLLIFSGFLIVKGNIKSIKLSFVTAIIMLSSGLAIILCYSVNYIIKPRLGLSFALEKLVNSEYLLFYIPCAYAIFLISYFSRPSVKEYLQNHR
jgi:hypothetical protein